MNLSPDVVIANIENVSFRLRTGEIIPPGLYESLPREVSDFAFPFSRRERDVFVHSTLCVACPSR